MRGRAGRKPPTASAAGTGKWPISGREFTRIRSESQKGAVRVRLLGQGSRELGLDARQRGIVIGFETHHHHRRGVGRARQAEAVGVLDTHAVDLVDLACAFERRVGADLVEQREGFALGALGCSSGVLLEFGSALGTALGSAWRDRISSRRARCRPSSKPYQRSLKKTWPLISPAIGAPVSASWP